MARASKTEDRFLDKDERELVASSRSKALRDLSQDDLIGVARRLRERRDRVQRQARGRRRDAKGSGQEAGPDAGAQQKKAALAAAVKRVNRELERRRAANRAKEKGVSDLTRGLRKALRRKVAAPMWSGPEYQNANEGMNPTPNEKIAVSGALHAEGAKPALERAKMAR